MAAIVLDGHLGKYILLKATLKDRSTAATTVFYPAGSFSRSTRQADTPSQMFVPGLLLSSINFGISLFTGADPVKISNNAGSGILDMMDSSRQLEYLHDYSWDNAPLEISRGEYDANYSLWTTVAKLTATDLIGNMDLKRIRLKDAAWKLQALIHNQYYDGTGGLNGGTNLKGVWKPYLIGGCTNIPPVLIDGPNQIFQVSWSSCYLIASCRHGGIPLTFDADYANYAALAAASIATGKFATCNAQGLVRPSVTLTKSIRVDAYGDNTTQNSQTRPMKRADVARRIATCYGDTNYADSSELDTTSFSAMNTAQTGEVGFFFDKETNKADALTMILSGILGYWFLKANGKLAVGYLRDPSALTPDTVVPFKSYGMSKIEMTDMISPRATTKIGWKKNWGPEDLSSLAAGVTLDDSVYYGADGLWSTVETGKAAIQAAYPSAQVVKLMANFIAEADADAEAARQHSLFSVPRRRYRFSAEIDQFADLVDQPITLTGANQLSLGSSKNLLCVGLDGPGFGPTTTEWWG